MYKFERNELMYDIENGKTSPFRIKKDSTRVLGFRVAAIESPNGNLHVVRGGEVDLDSFIKHDLGNFVKAEYNLLRQFGMNVVNFTPIKYFDGKKKRIVTLAEYVEGQPLSEANVSPEEIYKVSGGMVDYCTYKYDLDEDYLDDIADIRQYMHGRIKGGEAKTYLVDVGLNQNSRVQEGLRRKGTLMWMVVEACSNIHEIAQEKLDDLFFQKLDIFISGVDADGLSDEDCRVYAILVESVNKLREA